LTEKLVRDAGHDGVAGGLCGDGDDASLDIKSVRIAAPIKGSGFEPWCGHGFAHLGLLGFGLQKLSLSAKVHSGRRGR
jgi:hypothetical protein